ncbi:MAG: rhomboid family intramembrane serine protease [candidate division Zixibacteria bacterium]|nr:rhomboid family intramembrane serine protease [candidate division Zixibacteria bacterium]
MWKNNRYRPEGGLSIGPGAISPFIKTMLIFNIAVFVLQILIPGLSEIFGLSPAVFFERFPNLLYQPFTYMFLHGGFGHIFFNMFMLWMFGTEVEHSMGSKSFGRFYILAGLAGALLTLIVHPSQEAVMVGASGAINGVLVAYWIMFPTRLLYIYFLFPVQVKWAIPGLMLISFLFGGSNIAHMAHLGGAVCGFIYLKENWRWASFGSRFKNLRYRRQSAKLEKKRQEASEIMKRVDTILDKINEVGIENISKADRKFLEDASSELSKQKNLSKN